MANNVKAYDLPADARLVITSTVNEDKASGREFKEGLPAGVIRVADDGTRFAREQVMLPWFTATELAGGIKGYASGIVRLQAEYDRLRAMATDENIDGEVQKVVVVNTPATTDAGAKILTRKYLAKWIPNPEKDCFTVQTKGTNLGIQGPLNAILQKRYLKPEPTNGKAGRKPKNVVE